MLPELKFRPSLSVDTYTIQHRAADVLPELKFRPSLSADIISQLTGQGLEVLPELKFRPSLSVGGHGPASAGRGGVAGTKVPALIERCGRAGGRPAAVSVAGTKVPALIERPATVRSS